LEVVSGCFVFPVRLAGADHDRADHRRRRCVMHGASTVWIAPGRVQTFCVVCSDHSGFVLLKKKSEAKLDLASCRGLFLWVLDDLDQSICSPKHKLNQF
jgi:hypothetical protein